MSIFSELRMITSVVVIELASRYGWPIWTPMKISPAAAAATDAARSRNPWVMVTSFSLY